MHVQQQKVRGQLRTPSEGLLPGFTKPHAKRHKKNTGGRVMVLAGISEDRVAVWEEVRGRWNGARASEMYLGPIAKFLKAKYGNLPSYLIVEDNDPTGFKSKAGLAAKEVAKIRAMRWPRYSPDLMPLDFALWANINARMDACAPRGKETVAAFKLRLRRVALSTPRAAVRGMIDRMRAKAQEIYDADGGDIRTD